MGMGPMAWACLLLTVPGAGGAGQEPWYLNQPFKIPIRIAAEKRAQLQGFCLYVSRDQGQSWELQEKGPRDKREFAYRAPADGVYWFTVAVINARGEEEPNDVSTVPPNKIQKIVVDTTPPAVKIQSADRRGAEVSMTWHVQEDHPDASALRVEYRTADMPEGQWRPVPFVPGEREEVTFRPEGAGEVLVRVEAVDLAGNRSMDTRPVAGGAPGGTTITPVGTSTSEAASPLPVGGANETAGRRPDVGTTSRQGSSPPVVTGLPFENSSSLPPAVAPTPMSHPTAMGSTLPPAGPSAPVGPATPPAPAVIGGGGSPAGTAAMGAPLGGVSRGSLRPLQVVNNRQVKLNFDVAKSGPSGLGSVEVYVTADEGITWEPMPLAPDAFGLPPSGDAGNHNGWVMVQLSREGVTYGFRIVVKNRAGIGKPPPQRGDPPQVRLELDTTRPEAKLYAPQEDQTRPNALILAWTALDRNLASHPVVLEWAERKEGPWTSVSSEPLANNMPEPPGAGADRQNAPTGNYSWQLPDKMPPRVYLRLKVRDTAGNEALAETVNPVIIDLFKPDVDSVTVGNPGPR
jgi:hypothetical protein